MGRKAAKSQHDADNLAKVNMENGRSIAASLNKKAHLESETNAMKRFALAPCKTVEHGK